MIVSVEIMTTAVVKMTFVPRNRWCLGGDKWIHFGCDSYMALVTEQ